MPEGHETLGLSRKRMMHGNLFALFLDEIGRQQGKGATLGGKNF